MDEERTAPIEEERLPIHFPEDDERTDYLEDDPDGSLTFNEKRKKFKDLDTVITEDTKFYVNYAENYSKNLSVKRALRWISFALIIVLVFVAAFMMKEFIYNVSENGVEIEQYDGTFVHLFIKVPEEIEGVKVTSLKDYSFANLGQMRSITLPDTVKTVGNNCFSHCVWLRRVDLGEGVEEIGAQAFAECVNLRKLTLPESLKTLGSGVFKDCAITVTAPHEPEYYGYEPEEKVKWIVSGKE